MSVPEKREVESIFIKGKPNARQKEFFASRARYTAYGGARGGGKSWAIRRKLIAMCLHYPHIRCLIIRRSYAELKSNHLQPLLSEYGAILSYSESEKKISVRGGSEIYLGYCSCDRDVLRYQGQEYDVIAIDEATQLSEYQFSVFKACLRGVNGFPKRIYLTCNPGGVGHAWVKRLFIDRDFRSGENASDYLFIPAKVYDNDVLLSADPEYLGQLKALPKRLRDAWLEGRWDVFEGQFFSEFNEEVHTVNASVIPNDVSRFVAFDYGFDMLAGLLCVRDKDGRIYVVRETCRSGLTLGEAAREIVHLIGGERTEYAVASPDLWNRRQDSGKSGFEIMQALYGMPPMIPADDRRIPGWRVLREYLATDRDGRPKLLICSDCRELIHSMSSLLCDRNRIEDASGEPHSITHAPEALRYAVMSRYADVSGETELPFTFSGKNGKTNRYFD